MLLSSIYKSGDQSLMASDSHHNGGYILCNASMCIDLKRNDPDIIMSDQGVFFDRGNESSFINFIESLKGYNHNVVKSLQYQAIQSLLLSYNFIQNPDGDLLSSQEYNVFSVYNFKGNGIFEVVNYRKAHKILDYSLDNGDPLVENFNSIKMDLNNTVTPDELFEFDFFLNRIITKCFDSEDNYNEYLAQLRNEFNDELAKAEDGQPFFFEHQKLIACKTGDSPKVFMPKVLEECVYAYRHDSLTLTLNDPPNIFMPKYPGDNKKIEILSPNVMNEVEYMSLESLVSIIVTNTDNFFVNLRWMLWKRADNTSSVNQNHIFSILKLSTENENLASYLADSLYYIKKFDADHILWRQMFKELPVLANATIDCLIDKYKTDVPDRILDIYEALPDDFKEEVITKVANKMLSDIKSYSLVSLVQILNKIPVKSFGNYTQRISQIDLTGIKKISTLQSIAELKYKFKSKRFLLNEIEKLNIESISRFIAILICVFLFNKVVPFTSVIFAILQSIVSFLNIVFSLNISIALGFTFSGPLLGMINFSFCFLVSLYLCVSIDNLFVTKTRKNIRAELFRDYNLINYGKKDATSGLISWLLDPATSSAFLKLLKSLLTYIPRKVNSLFRDKKAILKVDSLINKIMQGNCKFEIDSVIQEYKLTHNAALLNTPNFRKFITTRGCSDSEFKSWLESRPRH